MDAGAGGRRECKRPPLLPSCENRGSLVGRFKTESVFHMRGRDLRCKCPWHRSRACETDSWCLSRKALAFEKAFANASAFRRKSKKGHSTSSDCPDEHTRSSEIRRGLPLRIIPPVFLPLLDTHTTHSSSAQSITKNSVSAASTSSGLNMTYFSGWVNSKLQQGVHVSVGARTHETTNQDSSVPQARTCCTRPKTADIWA